MSKLVLTLMVIAATFSLWTYDVKTYLQEKAFRSLHYAMEHGVHDAALMIDETELVENGKIVFNRSLAHDAFIGAFKANLGVDDSLNLKNHYFYLQPFKIVQETFIDNNYIDPTTKATVSFPYTYSYLNPLTGETLIKVIDGPSVVFVVEAWITGNDNKSQFLNIQEYKGK